VLVSNAADVAIYAPIDAERRRHRREPSAGDITVRRRHRRHHEASTGTLQTRTPIKGRPGASHGSLRPDDVTIGGFPSTCDEERRHRETAGEIDLDAGREPHA
jgi:hypothetical protein